MISPACDICQRAERPQHVRHLRESVPVYVDAALMCALSKVPADRFVSAGEVFQHMHHREIRSIDPLTGKETVLLAAPGTWWYDLRLSPDERPLAMRRTGDTDGVFTLDLQTRRVQAVTGEVFSPVHWSSDGRSIYVMRVDGRSIAFREIFAQPAAGGSSRLAFTLPPDHAAMALNVSMSTDARTIFAAVYYSTRDVWAISLAPERR